MKEETIKNLIEKYQSGTSSLEEESFLFDHINDEDSSISLWSDFVKNNKKEAPENFNNEQWKSFEKKIEKKKYFKIGFWSAAASIVLILSIYLGSFNKQEQTFKEKQALLEEAKNMFASSDQIINKDQIIIENDLIIVYTKKE